LGQVFDEEHLFALEADPVVDFSNRPLPPPWYVRNMVVAVVAMEFLLEDPFEC
jgi:hypothetical protein